MRIKSITYSGKADVYNMEVEDTHDFVIQGGIISHNCADEWRYFCMSRPIKPRANVPKDGYSESPLSYIFDIPKGDLMKKPYRQKIERV